MRFPLAQAVLEWLQSGIFWRRPPQDRVPRLFCGPLCFQLPIVTRELVVFFSQQSVAARRDGESAESGAPAPLAEHCFATALTRRLVRLRAGAASAVDEPEIGRQLLRPGSRIVLAFEVLGRAPCDSFARTMRCFSNVYDTDARQRSGRGTLCATFGCQCWFWKWRPPV